MSLSLQTNFLLFSPNFTLLLPSFTTFYAILFLTQSYQTPAVHPLELLGRPTKQNTFAYFPQIFCQFFRLMGCKFTASRSVTCPHGRSFHQLI